MSSEPQPEAVPSQPNAVDAQPHREVYVARPFVIYRDEIERCYNWFVERCQAAANRPDHGK